MNLKEAFRYQSFLENLMTAASAKLITENCLKQTKHHLCNASNPDVDDFTEEIEPEKDGYSVNGIIKLMVDLTNEKEKLTLAISEAKRSMSFDLDAAMATNKYRQKINSAVGFILNRKRPTNRTEVGIGYKFNAEGNQVQYKYNVEVTEAEAYDKEFAKNVMKDAIKLSDKVSGEIDAAKINTQVDYIPIFDVNDSLEEVLVTYTV